MPDETASRAAAILRDSSLSSIVDLTDRQQQDVRTALYRGLERGASISAVTNSIRDSIDLTDSQQATVDSYRALLERMSSTALDRELRDRRYDGRLQDLIDSGEMLSPAQIDRMVAAYESRMLDMRAETIARTETVSALNQANYDSLKEEIDLGNIDPSTVSRVWHATKDKRTRDSHRQMDGQSVGLDEPFTSGLGNELMYPGDPDAPAEDRINCRCTVTHEFS